MWDHGRMNQTLEPVEIYTDGGAIGNPGPGGYGAVVLCGGGREELSGGFRRTTNNRMELTAAIAGLSALKRSSAVTLHTDSKYLANGITKGWAEGWRRNDWRKKNGEKALNPDLWEKPLGLCSRHEVVFRWVKGHAGVTENERCDELTRRWSRHEGLPVDEAYEKANPARSRPARGRSRGRVSRGV